MVEGEGARAERARTKRVVGIAFLTAVAAVAIGAMVTFGRIATGTPLGHIPPAVAIAAAVLLPAILVGGAWASWKATDELDRIDTLKACTAGFYAFLSIVLAWLFLDQGDLLPPPNVLLIFFGSNLAFLIAYLRLKLQRR